MNFIRHTKLFATWQSVAIITTISMFFFSSASIYAKTTLAKPILNASAFAVADKYSAAAAEHIFKQGGNVVDATVAIAFTLAVTYPEAGNIGGGGFMTLYIDGKPYFLDYREQAPLAAKRNMFLDNKSNVMTDISRYGYRSAAVPGTVAGMGEVHKRFGKLSWQQVLAPAIKYAEEGFEVNKKQLEKRDKASPNFAGKTNFDQYFGSMKENVKFKQPELAIVLKRIAKEGSQDFYHGKTADLIVTDMQRNNGLITKRDLQQYKAIWRQPIIADWKGYQVITAPPPSSGGVGLVQLLTMKADLKQAFLNVPLNSAQYIHLLAELEKRVFADRAQYLGDPAFYNVPVTQLINPSYLEKRASEIDVNVPSDTKELQPGLGTAMPEKVETIHYSVVDKWGNAASNTYTLNGNFGSGVVINHAGFLLNDEMDDFSVKSGAANMFGVVGRDANAIAPGKRPLSSMTPTILTKNGKVVLVIGTPGGSRIFTAIFQVITNLYDFNLSLPEAVEALRFHHQLLPANTLFSEPYKPITGSLAKQLEAKGYIIQDQPFSTDIQVVKIGDKTESVSDLRRGGVARVLP